MFDSRSDQELHTRWITFEIDVERNTTEFVRALSRTLIDVVSIKRVESHVPESDID